MLLFVSKFVYRTSALRVAKPKSETSSRCKTEGLHYIFAITLLGSQGTNHKAQFAVHTSKHVQVIAYNENHLLKAKVITYER